LGTYFLYLLVSGVPLIARAIVVAWVAAKENIAFDGHDVLVAEQPFWFATVLCGTTFLRLTDRGEDFRVPWLYNLIRGLLVVSGATAFIFGLLIAQELYSGGTVPRDLVFTIAIWVTPGAILLGATQIGIGNPDRREEPHHV
jgi:hypothetical protein